jgi:nucleotide-binding universal stress UspA family protein
MEPKLVTIAIETYSRAEILKTRLESEGIECILTNVNLIHPATPGGVKVKISEKNLKQAVRTLQDFKLETGDLSGDDDILEIKRLLVPIDFSDYSRNACEFAIRMAEKLKAEVELLYAYFSPDLITIPYDESLSFNGTLPDHLEDIREQARISLEKYVNELRTKIRKEKIMGVNLDYTLIDGSVSEAILKAGDIYQSDLIIIGMRGDGKRKSDFIGSSTRKVMEKATIPVLAIPENCTFDEKKWSNKIVYATDFDESDFVAIRKLMGLVSSFDMKVYCIHVGEKKADSWEAIKMEGFREYFKSSYPGFRVECLFIEKPDVMEGLDEFIQKTRVDIISLTTHKRNIITKWLYPSLAKKLFYHTNIPLLVFHS